MPLIDASPEELFTQATKTASDYMRSAVEAIDRLFGEGFAAKHPDLVGSFMRTAAVDLATTMSVSAMEQSADKVSEAISGLLYGLKYSKDEGKSIAEAIEVAAEAVVDAVKDAAATAHGGDD